MKRDFKILCTAVAVLAVLQIVCGAAYTVYTVKEDSSYTYVECTVLEVKTSQEDEAVKVEEITVSYMNEEGRSVVARMADFPERFSVGSVFTGRYRDDPMSISAQKTDFFTPVFLIVLGAAYAIADTVFLLMRKKMGFYAMEDVREESADFYTDAEEEN